MIKTMIYRKITDSSLPCYTSGGSYLTNRLACNTACRWDAAFMHFSYVRVGPRLIIKTKNDE